MSDHKRTQRMLGNKRRDALMQGKAVLTARQLPEPPYLETHKVETTYHYNPNYGDDRECECGHPYYRHFDTYEDMYACGCKYCSCWEFKEKSPQTTIFVPIEDNKPEKS